ncbi:MAG: DctP family TRAP transporter solute-binding subunit [Pseudomonadota bacterium]|nr:C4-dicarboxylate ABC transporter [Gammaproteobacteria bacterium]MEE2683678.1 DctP family TRAP transporter solute-binding subunit [Pseudomonadota bacterium]|tara:strand:- start:4840 stop:5847 length:1008 start_codon:yes stop_codon:yes gene_type:complete
MRNYFLNRTKYLIFIFIFFVIASCSNDTTEGPYVIKFPHVTAPATPKGQAAQRFKELAEERFPGRVVVEVYPSSQLMNDDDSLEALAFGEIQMIAVSLSKFDRLTNAFQIFDLPFLFPDLQSIEKFQSSPAGQSLLEELTDRGFKGLNFWHNGMKIFTATRALNEPQDAGGLNFRIMESDVLQAQVQAIGGNPQKMALGEVYQALQTGAIDAQENTWANIYSAKFYEVQEYIMETNHGYVGYLVAVNPSFWNQLPEDIRIGLEETMDEVSRWGNMRSEIINQEGKEKVMQENRNEIINPSLDQLAKWQESMQPVWEEFSEQIGIERLEAAININN